MNINGLRLSQMTISQWIVIIVINTSITSISKYLNLIGYFRVKTIDSGSFEILANFGQSRPMSAKNRPQCPLHILNINIHLNPLF